MAKTIEITQVDGERGDVLDRNIHLNTGEAGQKLLLITQDGVTKAMLIFKTDKQGNVSDFKLHEIISSRNGLTLSKHDSNGSK